MSGFSSKYCFQSIRLGFTINGHDIDCNKVNFGSSFNDEISLPTVLVMLED
jgi:hypothetical protein